MKRLVLLSVLVIAVLALGACAPAEEEWVVTVAVENQYLPFNYLNGQTGEPEGWDYDVWEEICKRLGCTVEFVEASWEGMIQAVADGQFDAAGDGITITDERDEIVDFSIGYISLEQRLIVRALDNRISSIEDIVADESLKLGTQGGTTNYEVAKKYLPEERISAFETFPFAIQAVVSGDLDAAIIDDVAGQGYVGENSEALKLVGDSLSTDWLGFIYPEGSELKAQVDDVLREMMGDGFLDALNLKYFGPNFTITYDDIQFPE
ncbi:MAG: ABC transporter substrate-binding protein [Anaerolineales bacterium]